MQDEQHHKSEQTLEHARQILEQRFVKQAQDEGAQDEVDNKLDHKRRSLHGQSKTMQNLRALVDQAGELWNNRGKLNRKQVIYLTAGLLYFISPVDAVTDVIPLLGYIDDVAVLGWILSQITPVATGVKDQLSRTKDKAIEQTTDRLVEKGRNALNEVVDQRSEELLQKLDDAADDALAKYVTAAAIGLWGTTSAAAISLALSLLSGSYGPSWLLYVGLTSILVISWNLAVAILFWRRYQSLDQSWRERLPRIIGSRLMTAKNLIALGLPVLCIFGLAAAHLMRLS